MQSKTVGFGALLALAGSVCAPAQRSTLSKVEFRNAGALRQTDLQAVAGVRAGESVTLKQMQDAAQHLIDSGFFEDVQVESRGSGAALDLIFVLKPVPADQIATVEFENFVWLPPQELEAVVQKVVPLFHGELPESGTSLDQIDAALEAALAAKGVAAHVGYEAAVPTSEDPVHRLQFWVEMPFVQVRSATVEGADGPLGAAVRAAEAKLKGSQLREGEEGASTANRLLAPFRDAGYARASLQDVKFTVAEGTGKAVMVDVSARVEPGPMYKVGGVTLADSPLMSGAAFAQGAKVHAGDVASQKALLESLGPVDAAYEKQGYFEAYVKTVPHYDDAAHTVSYALTVVPGEQYRLKTVTVDGLAPALRAEFDKAWLLKPGDLYDPGYVKAFLANNTAVQGLAKYAGAFKAVSDPQTHLVDLKVNFAPAAGAGRS